MNAATWISLVSPGLIVTGGIVAAVMKMTRLVDAVERLEKSMSKIADKVQDHENRLNKGGL